MNNNKYINNFKIEFKSILSLFLIFLFFLSLFTNPYFVKVSNNTNICFTKSLHSNQFVFNSFNLFQIEDNEEEEDDDNYKNNKLDKADNDYHQYHFEIYRLYFKEKISYFYKIPFYILFKNFKIFT